MISVITVCFNCEKTIQRALNSILFQTDSNYEHIIVDGKSTDNTLKLIEAYREEGEKRNIVVRVVSEEDDGLYDALNKGIRMAQGEYIGILNGDDWYEVNTIENVNKAIKRFPNTDIFMGASTRVGTDKTSIKRAKNSKFITSRNFNHGAMFVSRNCYSEIGGYVNDGNYYADFRWYVKAIKTNRNIMILPHILYNFSMGGMSTVKEYKEVSKRIKYRYATYRENDCSRLYCFECLVMEICKFIFA